MPPKRVTIHGALDQPSVTRVLLCAAAAGAVGAMNEAQIHTAVYIGPVEKNTYICRNPETFVDR